MSDTAINNTVEKLLVESEKKEAMKISLRDGQFTVNTRDKISRSKIDGCTIIMHENSTIEAISPCDLTNNVFVEYGSGMRVYSIDFTKEFPWLWIKRIL